MRARIETVGLAVDVPDTIAVAIDARLVGGDTLEGDVIHGTVLPVVGEAGSLARRGPALSPSPVAVAPLPASLHSRSTRRPASRGVEQGRDLGGERWRTECDQIVVEVAVLGDDDGGGNAQVAAAPPFDAMDSDRWA